jgi:transposase InsO family protein
VYTPRKDNGRADALSRRHDVVRKKTNVFMLLLQENEDRSLGPSKEVCSILRIAHKVPEELQQRLIESYHNDLVHRHPRITRTIELIRRNYEFKNMKDKITNFIKKCANCQRNKHSTHAKYGEMQAIELPTKPWTDISIDFVTRLPESRDPTTKLKYDAILVVVDRFTKAAEYILFRKNYTVVQLGHIINNRVIHYHSIPKTIISDRDKLFTSNYWATLIAAIGTKRKLSTAYHPQTDSQTERTNRTIKTYLRIYANKKQDN